MTVVVLVEVTEPVVEKVVVEMLGEDGVFTVRKYVPTANATTTVSIITMRNNVLIPRGCRAFAGRREHTLAWGTGNSHTLRQGQSRGDKQAAKPRCLI